MEIDSESTTTSASESESAPKRQRLKKESMLQAIRRSGSTNSPGLSRSEMKIDKQF